MVSIGNRSHNHEMQEFSKRLIHRILNKLTHTRDDEFIAFGGGVGMHSTEEPFLLPAQQPGFESWLRQDFFSLLLSLSTILRLNPFNAR